MIFTAIHYLALTYAFLGVFGGLTNSIIIITTIRSKNLHNTCNFLIALCALSDILHLLGHLPKIIPIFHGTEEISSSTCFALQLLPNFGLSGGVFILFLIAMDRFLSVHFSAFYLVKHSNRNLMYHIFAVFAYVSVQYAIAYFSYKERNVVCNPSEMYYGVGKDLWAVCSLTIILLSVIVYCVVWRKLRKTDVLGNSRRVYRSILAVSCSLIIGWLLSMTIVIFVRFVLELKGRSLYIGEEVAGLPANITLSLNCILLYLTSIEYRAAIRKQLRISLISSCLAKEPLKILVYNVKFGHSHSSFLGNIADILSEEGHNVTSLIPEIYPPLADGTTKSTVVRIPADPSNLEFYLKGVQEDFSFLYRNDDWDKTNMVRQMPFLRQIFEKQCEFTLTFEKTIEDLKKEKFDVMIAETRDYCGIGLSHLISPRSLITVASTNIFDYLSYQIGQPLFPSHLPASFGGSVNPHSITSRIDNLIAMFTSFWMFREIEKPAERLFKRKYGENFPDMAEIIANSAFTLTNSDPFLDIAKPTLRKVIEIGGIGLKKAKKIDEEWESSLSLRPRTVLVSFGTVARAFLMPLSMKKSIAEAFSRFPDTTFIWKYEKPEEKEEFASGVDNLILTKWMPQNDLLEDNRVQGFLTHAGKASYFEAASRGKSSLLVPLFGDQLRNAAAAEFVGIGKHLDKEDLNDSDKLEAALRETLEDEGRLARAREVRRVMESRPFTPRELLVKHVEFAGKFGALKTLQSQGRELSYIVYYNIDIVGILVVILFLTTYLFCRSLHFVFTYVRVRKVEEKLKTH